MSEPGYYMMVHGIKKGAEILRRSLETGKITREEYDFITQELAGPLGVNPTKAALDILVKVGIVGEVWQE